ncbi:MAG: hypothetical protein A2X36_15790 [Elusimicrobia bacterium GWA2_69_24]|nr:MAG: hypothetical protein A2X36_15790 [Elusimicrobia bacterium GWA2_69_24]HBL16922.1 hypothetical protein [Elusimicrobiota bacterium]
MGIILVLSSALALAVPGPAQAADAPAAAAAPAPASSLSSWFKHWQLALKKSAVEARYRKVRTTSVAAVRGAGQKGEDPKKVAWKGGWSEKKAAERMKEREELSAAVDLILNGKTDEAQAALDAFEKSHPLSGLLTDVREAKVKLAEMRGAAPTPAAAEVKPAQPAETPAPEAKPAEAKPVETKTPEAKPAESSGK